MMSESSWWRVRVRDDEWEFFEDEWEFVMMSEKFVMMSESSYDVIAVMWSQLNSLCSLATAYALPIHCWSTAYSRPSSPTFSMASIHCLLLPLHRLPIHCLLQSPIHCLSWTWFCVGFSFWNPLKQKLAVNVELIDQTRNTHREWIGQNRAANRAVDSDRTVIGQW
jgi:hypothetical protein